jgi:hypothetical protein
MKKFYMTMVAMLCGVAAMAQEADGLYVDNVKVDKGVTEAVASICLKNSIPVSSISFRIELPEGVTIPLTSKGKFKDGTSFEFGERAEDWGTDYQLAGTTPQIAVFATEAMEDNDGEVIALNLAISEEVAANDAEFTVNLTNIGYAAPKNDPNTDAAYNDGRSYVVSGEMTQTETSFTLTIGEGTGIIGINADESNAPIYNVAGQRVNKAQKGVYIQNGKKVAVK